MNCTADGATSPGGVAGGGGVGGSTADSPPPPPPPLTFSLNDEIPVFIVGSRPFQFDKILVGCFADSFHPQLRLLGLLGLLGLLRILPAKLPVELTCSIGIVHTFPLFTADSVDSLDLADSFDVLVPGPAPNSNEGHEEIETHRKSSIFSCCSQRESSSSSTCLQDDFPRHPPRNRLKGHEKTWKTLNAQRQD